MVADKCVETERDDACTYLESEEARDADVSYISNQKSPSSSKNVTFTSESESESDHDEEESENESHNHSRTSKESMKSFLSRTSSANRKSNRKTSESDSTEEGDQSVTGSKRTSQKSRVSDAYDSLLDSGRRSDSIISVIGGHNFHVHSAVLTARSPVLADMLDENESKISLTEYDEDLFRHFLKFVYSGKLPKETIEENVFKLVRIALRFEVVDLKKACMKVINRNMSVKNLMDCISVADECKITRLKNKALKFANENMEEVVDEHWETVFQHKDKLAQFLKTVLPAKKEKLKK
ncbi:hypothetical protein B4U80_11787 [Leptotrombidium deliense]|uniref:BTB domain-containing protein n=1 Tax=Leptotrombidium deliense TaxID=299467 RepID=A0A443S2D8_9ACAR|nr:hypothetical protein B4U80_11787 [Leptotrombidium deliense]